MGYKIKEDRRGLTPKLLGVAQAATDILEVSKIAIETEVTSEVEETLLATQHTYRDRGSILQRAKVWKVE